MRNFSSNHFKLSMQSLFFDLRAGAGPGAISEIDGAGSNGALTNFNRRPTVEKPSRSLKGQDF